MIKTLITIFGFLFGIGIGSFLGAVVWRIQNKEKITKGRSKCPKCGHELAWHDLIPLFSFLFQRWKCKYCKEPIHPYYFFIELTTGVVFAVVFNIFTSWILTGGAVGFGSFEWVLFSLFVLAVLSLCSGFILLSYYDLLYKLVPDIPLAVSGASAFVISVVEIWFVSLAHLSVNLPVAFPENIGLSYFSITFSPTLILVHKLLGALFLFLFFFVLNRATKQKGMGWGDVVFAPIAGGLLGLLPGFIALMISFVFGSIVSSIWAMSKYKKIKGVEVPYLPFLCLASLVVFLFQPAIMKLVIHYVFGL